jgi:hypothetical protein
MKCVQCMFSKISQFAIQFRNNYIYVARCNCQTINFVTSADRRTAEETSLIIEMSIVVE